MNNSSYFTLIVAFALFAGTAAVELQGSAVTYWHVATPEGRSDVVAAMQAAHLNTLSIDAKTEDGYLGYTSSVASSANMAWSTPSPLVAMTSLLHANGLFSSARISVGQDELYANAHPSERVAGTTKWVNLCSANYQAYVIGIVREIAALQVDVINLDFFRGPDVDDGNAQVIVCSNGVSYRDVLPAFAAQLASAAKEVNPSVLVSVDVFARAAASSVDDPIGQSAAIVNGVDFISPMLYKSQFLL